MLIGSPKRKFIQLGIETYFSLNNMPQTVKDIKYSIEDGWLKKMKCMVMFQYLKCGMHFGIMKSELILAVFCRNSLSF